MAQLQSTSITGSLIVTQGITGSFSGSITNAVSASYAATASYALNAGDSIWTGSAGDIYYNGGNVGIGTTSPSVKLDVNGRVSVGGGLSGNALSIATSIGTYTFNNYDFQTPSSFLITAGSSGYLSLDGYPVIFKVTGTERMRVDTSGNVGIGVTNPAYKLHVENNLNGGLLQTLRNTNTGTDQYVEFKIGTSDSSELRLGSSYNYAASQWNQTWIYAVNRNLALKTSAGYDIRFYAGGTDDSYERMRITNGGNVGIGTTNPTETLSISGTSTSGVGISLANGDGTGGRILADNSSLYFYSNSGTLVYSLKNSKIRLNDGNGGTIGVELGSGGSISQNGNGGGLTFSDTTAYLSNGLVVSAGNVGIGTTSPGYKLDVNGDTNITGNLYFNSNSTLQPARRYVSTANLSSAGYTVIGTVTGDALASSIRISLQGTTNSTVINVMADILVNHYQDILITSYAGMYTTLTLRVISNNNEIYSIEATTDSAFACTTYIEIFPLNSETVVFGGSAQTGTSLTHPCVPGMNVSATGGNSGNLAVGGDVGIGTTSPGTKLDVAGTSRSDMHIFRSNQSVPTADAFIFRPANNTVALGTANTERLRIDASGNVGIGITSPAQKLHVEGIARLGGSTADGALYVYSSNGTLNSLISGPGNTYLNATYGNVGIGTTSPNARLTVVANDSSNPNVALRLSSTAYSGVSYPYTSIRFGSAYSSYPSWNLASIDAGYTGASWGGSLLFYTNNDSGETNLTERMRITSAGNIGIGTTSPSYRLDVNGVTRFQNVVRFVNNAWNLSDDGFNRFYFAGSGRTYFGSGGGYEWRSDGDVTLTVLTNGGNLVLKGTNPFTTGGTATLSVVGDIISLGASDSDLAYFRRLGTGQFQWQTYNSGNSGEIHLQPYGGNVGIGTTSPSYKLDVNVASQHVARFTSTTADNGGLIINKSNASYNPNILLQAGGNTKWYILNASNDSDKFQLYESTGINPRFTLTQAGNVGIGTDSPAQRLNIKGSAGNGFALTHSNNTIIAEIYELSGAQGAGVLLKNSAGTTNILLNAGGESYINGGNVGIGTTSPTTPLRVEGGGAMTGGWNKNTTLAATFPVLIFNSNATKWAGIGYDYSEGLRVWLNATSDDVNTVTPQFNILNNGNVGIGTGSPAYKLDVNGTGRFSGRLYADSNVTLSGYIQPSSNVGYGVKSSNGTILQEWYDGAIYNYGTSYFAGNVGIGTTAPAYKLHVYNNTNGFISRFTGGTSSDVNIGIFGYTGAFGSIGTESNHPLNIFTNGTDRMTIATGGNVGIGTTSPGQKLQVEGSLLVNTGTSVAAYRDIMLGGIGGWSGGESHGIDTVYGSAGSPTTFSRIESHFDGTNGKIRFRNLFNGSAPRTDILMTIQGDGNVGIGTDSPTSTLHVYNNADIWHTRIGGASGELRIGGQTASGAVIQALEPGGAIRQLYLQRDGGNVGIGTSSPTATLQINGAGGDTAPTLRLISTASDVFNWASSTQHANLTAGETSIHLIGKANSQYNQAYFGYRHVSDGSSSNMVTIGMYASDYLLNILGNGHVGIGTTAPSQKFVVSNGSAEVFKVYSTGEVIVGTNYIYAAASGNSFYSEAAANFRGGIRNDVGAYLQIDGGSSGNTYFNGNVGIGTTTPSHNLHIYGAGDRLIKIENTGTYLMYAGLISNEGYIGSSNATPLGLYTNNVNRLYINTSGNIGIGTVSPGYKLDVQGNSGLITINTNGLLSAGGQIISGTGEFASTSSGTDLNFRAGATHLMVLKTTGCVGIGTTAPASMLHIYGSGSTFTRYTNTTSAGHFIDIGANSAGESFVYGYGAYPVLFGTNNTERMRITSGGNVGIGINSPAELVDAYKSFNGDVVCQISNPNAGTSAAAQFFASNGTNRTQFFHTGTSYTGAGVLTSAAGLGGLYNATVQGLAFLAANASGTIKFATGTGNDERMRITGDGNVGIGTTSPSNGKLQVNGRIYTVGTAGTANAIFQGGQLEFYKDATPTYAASIGLSGPSSGGTNDIVFETYGGTWSERMRIATGGNVGIGTTSPAFPLHVVRSSGDSVIVVDSGAAYNSQFRFQEAGGLTAAITFVSSDDSLRFYNGGDRFTILSNGSVGIGTTSPTQALTIQKSGYPIIDFYDGATGRGDIGYNTGTTSFNVSAYSSTPMAFYSNGLERMRITSGGNVGIGLTTPQKVLDVFGSAGILGSFGASLSIGQFAGIHFGYSESHLNNDSYKKSALVFERTDNNNQGGNASGKIHFLLNNNSNSSATTLSSAVVTIDSDANGTIGSVRMGVGTRNPTATLNVSGSTNVLNVRGSGSAATSSIFSVDGNNGRLFEVSDDLSNSLFSVNTIAGLPVIEAFADYTVTMGTYGAYTLQVTGSRVGVGTSSPGYPLHVSGSVSGISIYATNDIAAFSDQSVKTDLQVIDSAVDRIKQINGYTYVRVDDLSNTRRAGVIAQEVQKVLPEVVSENTDGTLNVAYSNMIALLIEGMKEQQIQIDKLREDLEDLRYEL